MAKNISTADAFRLAREAFGRHSDVSEQLTRIERIPDGCSRIFLAAALFAFTSGSRDRRTEMIVQYFKATAHPPAEMLTHNELVELERIEREICGEV